MSTTRTLRLGLALGLLGVVGAIAPFGPGTSRADAWTEGPCPTADGVTVVVDFQELGGGLWVRCAPGTSDTGFQALQRAGVPYTTTVRFPGFLCRIDGRPASDPCQTTSPASAYWSYWVAPRGGTWCYSSLGGAVRNPPEGTVEGWSFSLGRSSGAIPTPRYAPPAAVPGTPSSLPDAGCDAAQTPPTTTAPAPGPSAPMPTDAPRSPATTGSGRDGANAAGSTPSGGEPAGTAPPAAGGGGGTTAAPDTAPAEVGGASTVPDAAPAPDDGPGDAASDDASPSTIVTPDGEEVALNAPGEVSTASSGSPLGVVLALLLIAALSATSFVVRRRARVA